MLGLSSQEAKTELAREMGVESSERGDTQGGSFNEIKLEAKPERTYLWQCCTARGLCKLWSDC